MLKNKKILFFGTNNEISIAIIENFLKQNAIVSFVSQNEFTDIGILDRIPKNYFVKDYYSTEKIEDIFKTELKNENGFDGIVFGGGIGGVRPIKLNKIDFVKTMFDNKIFDSFRLYNGSNVSASIPTNPTPLYASHSTPISSITHDDMERSRPRCSSENR